MGWVIRRITVAVYGEMVKPSAEVTALFYILPEMNECSCFSASLQVTFILPSFGFKPFQNLSHCHNFISLTTNDIEHFFHILSKL